jgi:hypothetical protein
VWVLVQGLLLIGIAYDLRSVGYLGPWKKLFGADLGLALVVILQLPASLVTLGTTRMVTLWIEPSARTFHSLVIGQSVVASVANALFWIHIVPRFADHMESHWPFENGHRRRLEALRRHR